MVSFPNCKINIGLRVIDKRNDGFHNIETIFYPVNLRDAVEIIEAKETTFSNTGIDIPGSPEHNLCLQAYHLLKKDFPQLPFLQIHLHKAVPIGAGLGGGSADASFILKLINQKFDLQLSNGQLINYALQLGSDCPFFIINKPCHARGRGEILKEVVVDLSDYQILIVNPGIHINTGWAFSKVGLLGEVSLLQELIGSPIENWQHHIQNDFEKPVFEAHPAVAAIKDALLSNAAVYASMSGSGSTVYGIFKKGIMPVIKFPADYFCKWV